MSNLTSGQGESTCSTCNGSTWECSCQQCKYKLEMREAAEQEEAAYEEQEHLIIPLPTTPSNDPSILGWAVGTKIYKHEAYGSIPSTQSDNTTNKNKANKIMDNSDHTDPSYEQFNIEVNC